MNTQLLMDQIEKLLEPILGNLGYELLERELILEQGRWVLRLYIDRNGASVTIDDCEKASRAVEGVLDVENLIPHRYALEVSSPGLNRPLRRAKDFERFVGQEVEVKTKRPIEGRHHFTGILQGLAEEQISVRIGDRDWLIPMEDLKKARLKHRF